MSTLAATKNDDDDAENKNDSRVGNHGTYNLSSLAVGGGAVSEGSSFQESSILAGLGAHYCFSTW